MVLVLVFVVPGVVLVVVDVVASHYCYRCKKNTARSTKSITRTTRTTKDE